MAFSVTSLVQLSIQVSSDTLRPTPSAITGYLALRIDFPRGFRCPVRHVLLGLIVIPPDPTGLGGTVV